MAGSVRVSRRRFLCSCAALAAGSAGCGTILHPERRGQPAGDLDWGIVALDAIGLFFFFIPGVIAFAVDFSNGTIYLPPRHYGEREIDARPGALRSVSSRTSREFQDIHPGSSSRRQSALIGECNGNG